MMIKVGIIGAAGYTGGELIRLLHHHPEAEIVFVHSKSQAGKLASSIHEDLIGETDLVFTNEITQHTDVLFLCMGHGESSKFLQEHTITPTTKIIDLSQDFRWIKNSEFQSRKFTYGLPELNKENIIQSNNIANPGCFATALQLGLIPLVLKGFKGNVYATGITGSTGAGQKPSASTHFSWRSNNIQAYKSLTHQHLLEVKESLTFVSPSSDTINISFIPWRGDFPKGIFISLQLETDISASELQNHYQEYYQPHPFTFLSEDPIHLKQVVNTNKCLIQIEQQNRQTVIHVAIDNLLKGASGQAVQNMNLMFGLNEKEGLNLKANYF